MTANLKFQCPNCGAPINYDPTLAQLQCEACHAQFSPDDVRVVDEYGAFTEQASTADVSPPERYYLDPENENLAQFICSACGGVIVGSPTLISSTCPYCDNNFIAANQLTAARPDRIIPFANTRDEAIEALEAEIKKIPLLPQTFRDRHVIEEVKGLYVPYWLFDASFDMNAAFQSTRTGSSWRTGDKRYTEILTYRHERSGTVDYVDVPALASTRVEPLLAQAVEPYDYRALGAFNPAYLAGFMAENYDVEVDAVRDEAVARMRSSTTAALQETASYSGAATLVSATERIREGQMEYALLPMWLLRVSYGGQEYKLALNGQTGKFVGTFPVSNAKFFALWIVTAIIAAAAFFGLFSFFVLGW